MNSNNFDEEEVSGDELKSVALTMGSFIAIVICVTSWVIFT